MYCYGNIPVLILLLVLCSARAEQDKTQVSLANIESPGGSGRLSGILTTPEDTVPVVYRPKSLTPTSSESRRRNSEKHVARTLPLGPAKSSTFGNHAAAFVGNRGQNSPGLVLRDAMPKSARFFGMQTVQSKFSPSSGLMDL